MQLVQPKRLGASIRARGVTAAFLAFNQAGEGSNPSGPN